MNEEQARARLRLIQIEKEKLALQSQDQPEVSVAPQKQKSLDSWRGVAQSLNKGFAPGFGDEFVGGARALIDGALPNSHFDLGEGSSNKTNSMAELAAKFAKNYAMYRDDERDVTKQYEKENPKKALALNIIGGIASPINRIAPGLAVGGNFKQRALAAALRGGVEGAVYGLGEGEGDLKSQLNAAKTGALYGGGTALGLNVIGGGLGKLYSNKRVQENLVQPLKDSAGQVIRDAKGKIQTTFKPINLASPNSTIGKLYRDVVGVAYGGGKIGQQESNYLRESLRRTGQDVDTLIPDSVGTRNAVGDVKKAITAESVAARQAAKSAGKAETKNENRVLRETIEDADTRFAQRNTQINSQLELDEKIVREQAARSALPENELYRLDGVNISSGREAKEALDKFWKRDGDAFRMVKDNVFDWEGSVDKTLKNDIRRAMSEDPNLAIKAAGSLSQIKGLVNKFKRAGMTKNQDMIPEDFIEQMISSTKVIGIKGDALMELRNVFAIAANKGKNRSAQMVKEKFDDLITSQLDDVSKDAFSKQKESYTSYLAHKNATNKAQSKLGGDFTVEQYRTAANKYNGGGSNAPLDEITLTAQQKINNSGNARQAEQQALKNEKKNLNNAARVQKEKIADRRDNKIRRQSQLADARKNYVERELRGATIENPSSGNKLVATAQIGAIPSTLLGPLSLGSSVATGLVGAPILATQRMQRMAAGQLPTQELLAEALRNGTTAKATQLLSRSAAGQAAGTNYE